MSGKKSDPPRGAIWLLRHLGPASGNEALTGDLVENFREGRSSGWFWKQVLIATAVGVLTEIRRHWPLICYAIAGTVLIAVPSVVEELNRVSAMVPWWVEPWWVSALHSLMASPILAAALLMNGAFRWVSLLRTWIINLMLLALPPTLLGAIIGPHIMPLAVAILVFFSTFFVSAWLGCRSPRSVTPTVNPA